MNIIFVVSKSKVRWLNVSVEGYTTEDPENLDSPWKRTYLIENWINKYDWRLCGQDIGNKMKTQYPDSTCVIRFAKGVPGQSKHDFRAQV